MSCRATLQPVLYSPLAMWALQGASPLVDRSGNARNLTGTLTKGPDLQLTKTGARGPGNGVTQSDPVFRMLGAMTFTARAWWDGSAALGVLADQSLAGTGTDKNTIWLVAVNYGQLGYYREVNGGTGAVTVYHTKLWKPGRWYFVSLRRAADGAVTLGVDREYETTAVTPPADGSASTLMLCKHHDPAQNFNGGFADVAVWNARLTDDELVPLYRASMGR